MGVDVGCPDLILTLPDKNGILHVLYMELKTKKGKLSAAQIEWNKKYDIITLHNTRRCVCYGYDECITKFHEWIEGL